jgi:hypothetical protein
MNGNTHIAGVSIFNNRPHVAAINEVPNADIHMVLNWVNAKTGLQPNGTYNTYTRNIRGRKIYKGPRGGLFVWIGNRKKYI